MRRCGQRLALRLAQRRVAALLHPSTSTTTTAIQQRWSSQTARWLHATARHRNETAPASTPAAAPNSAAAASPAAPAATPAATATAAPGAAVSPLKAGDSKDGKKPPRGRFRYYAGALVLCGALWYYRSTERQRLVDAAYRELIGPTDSELRGMTTAANLTTAEAEEIYTKAYRVLNPALTGGVVNAEEFGLIVWETATEKRARDTAASAEHKLAREARSAARLQAETDRLLRERREDDADDEDPALSVADKLARKRQRELNRASAALIEKRLADDEREDDAEEAVDEEDRSKHRWSTWELLGLYRTLDLFPAAPAPAAALQAALQAGMSPQQAAAAVVADKNAYRMRLIDLLTGVSVLINDTDPPTAAQLLETAPPPLPTDADSDDVKREKEAVIQKRLKTRRRTKWEREFDRKRPHSKLQFAFRLHDADADGALTYRELLDLTERMVLTGHFAADSLIRTTAWPPAPATYRVLTPIEIVELVLTDVQRHRSRNAATDATAPPATAAAPAAAAAASAVPAVAALRYPCDGSSGWRLTYPMCPPHNGVCQTAGSRFDLHSGNADPNTGAPHPNTLLYRTPPSNTQTLGSRPLHVHSTASGSGNGNERVVNVNELIDSLRRLTDEDHLVVPYLVDKNRGWWANKRVKYGYKLRRIADTAQDAFRATSASK